MNVTSRRILFVIVSHFVALPRSRFLREEVYSHRNVGACCLGW